ncbi:unnamed protein product [Eruca vesicaria subsp. sativa]|uniref:Uncharacterized protein n=1 Tax=Eruca vesicaria subsp. sativa TaxID=29727 RepID=A0ABC8JT07_ERUVS|nr:unnamed protein product [Eruca vesicaria subsp. sativa]
MSPATSGALSDYGVNLDLTDAFLDRKQFDYHLFYELVAWRKRHPSPANILLILRHCEEGLAGVLHAYPKLGYNLLLACPLYNSLRAYPAFASIKTRFPWLLLAKGEYEAHPNRFVGQAALEELVVAIDQATLEDKDGNEDKRKGSGREETEERKRAGTDDETLTRGKRERSTSPFHRNSRKRKLSPERASATRHDEGSNARGSGEEPNEEDAEEALGAKKKEESSFELSGKLAEETNRYRANILLTANPALTLRNVGICTALQ